MSRSSLTLWALATLYFFFSGLVFKGRIAGKFLGVILIGGLGALLVAGQIPIIVDSVGMDDLLSDNMRDRLSSGFFTQQDNSTIARLEAAEASFVAFANNPILGIGLGGTDFTESGVGSHNQHLKTAAEMGIFGFLVFLALMVVAVNSRSMLAIVFVTSYFLNGMADHSLLYGIQYAVLIPLGVVFIPELIKKGTPVKKRRRKRRRKTSSFAEKQLSA